VGRSCHHSSHQQLKKKDDPSVIDITILDESSDFIILSDEK
jgi:hypothetical protein